MTIQGPIIRELPRSLTRGLLHSRSSGGPLLFSSIRSDGELQISATLGGYSGEQSIQNQIVPQSGVTQSDYDHFLGDNANVEADDLIWVDDGGLNKYWEADAFGDKLKGGVLSDSTWTDELHQDDDTVVDGFYAVYSWFSNWTSNPGRIVLLGTTPSANTTGTNNGVVLEVISPAGTIRFNQCNGSTRTQADFTNTATQQLRHVLVFNYIKSLGKARIWLDSTTLTEEINFTYGATTATANGTSLYGPLLPADNGQISQMILGEGILTDGDVAGIVTYLKSIDYNAQQVFP